MIIELKADESQFSKPGAEIYIGFYRIDGGEWVRVTGISPDKALILRLAAHAAAGAV